MYFSLVMTFLSTNLLIEFFVVDQKQMLYKWRVIFRLKLYMF